MFKFLRYVVLFFLLSCSKEKISEAEIKGLITNNNVSKVVEGYFIIGEKNQTNFIDDMFLNINDSRISHHYRFKGISVYQSKMIALRKISGLNSLYKITSKPDKRIICFYFNWALKNNYIKNQKVVCK